VQDRVAELQAARVQLLKVTQDQVVREFAKLAFVNMQDFITVQADGSAYTDLSKLTRDQAVAIQEITVDQYRKPR
jgi:phage terminase small subunit